MNKARTFVRPLTAEERQALDRGRKPADAFTVRWSQVLLASADRMCRELAAEGKKVLALVWDNAAWHVSGRVRRWVERHNRSVSRATEGCRIRVRG